MDKETLSNYGWIVICVLVLAVMIALATPFGTFVADAVKSTTQGLFDVNQNALNSTGLINIDGQEFDSCAHEYEMTGTTANCTTAGTTTYTCKLCNKSYSEETPAGHKITDGTCESCDLVLNTLNIDGKAYYCEEGMTWREWLNSEYNTDEFILVIGVRDIVNGKILPNWKYFMTPTKDKYIAYSPDGGVNTHMPSIDGIISTSVDWSLYPTTNYVPIE